jgi:hypothetical protein
MATLYAGVVPEATLGGKRVTELPGSADNRGLEGPDDDLPHLSGPAAAVRQVLAAHFVRGFPHIVEIGGHLRPITQFLTHRPVSVLVVDPKTPPCEFHELDGRPCHVRHMNRKYQDVEFAYEPGSYGLVLLGLSLKPFGNRGAVEGRLLSLMDNAGVTVIDYPPVLERAASQIGAFIERSSLEVILSLELNLNDAMIRASGFARRRLFVLKPAISKFPRAAQF